MSDFHYVLGLDIGISSVGWAVLQNDFEGEPARIQDLGVRVFDKAEQPKTGASLALPRREARSARRRLRRHRHRLERIRYLLEQANIMSVQQIQDLYSAAGFAVSPYQLRAEALDRLLTKEETTRVLIHLAQRRGYRSNSTSEDAKNGKESGKIKIAIAENQACMTENGYRTIGEMMYRDQRFWQKNPDGTLYHQTRNKANDYSFTVERSSVVEEIEKIFAAQRRLGSEWMNEKLEKAYIEIFSSQRNFDEGPGGDSPYSGDIEDKVGLCTFEDGERRAAKASYTFECFKLLQDLNHIRIVSKDGTSRPLTADERETLKAAAFRSASLTYGQIRKKLSLPDDCFFNNLFYGNKTREDAEKQKWLQMQSYHKLRQALNEVRKGAIATFRETQLDDMADILTKYKGDARRIEELRKAQIPEQYYAALLPLSFSKFGNFSIAAMQKLIPLLEQGLRYDEACKQIYGDHRGNKPKQRKSRLSLYDMEDDITNPVVRRAVSQTIKVVNAVVRTYGPPDVVRVELAREMSRSFKERKITGKQQNDNRAKNERIRQQIREYKGGEANGLDIVKFKLYEEQNGVCLYSGQNLDISRLFEPGYVEVDHIIPYSRCFDDSYHNKALVLTHENREKRNRLPYEYFGQNEERWHKFEGRVESLIRDYRKRQKLLKQSLTDTESSGFVERNLKDTQYISRAVYNLLRNNLEFADSKYNRKNASPVYPVNGAVTSMLRNRWGIQKIREDGDLHHCLDAAVIAVASPALIRRLSEYYKCRETLVKAPGGYVDLLTGELVDGVQEDRFPEPWSKFRQELEARLSPDPRKKIDSLKLPAYESDEQIKPVFVSRMPNHKVSGAAHEETIRSSKAGEGLLVSKVPLNKLSLKEGEIVSGNAKYYNPASDMLLYNALLAQLKRFDGKGDKAFTEPFYKPKSDGTPGPRVDKVKMVEKSTLNLPVRGGAADNGDMVRIDVFYVEGEGYYFIPVYVSDTKEKKLPTKAACQGKAYPEWRKMDDRDFVFSLYKGDLIRIQSKKPIKLNQAKGGTGAPSITQKPGDCAMYYYSGANIANGQIKITTHDRRYEQGSLGFKTLLSVEKYQVDVLGNYYPVKVPEKRMPFRREN